LATTRRPFSFFLPRSLSLICLFPELNPAFPFLCESPAWFGDNEKPNQRGDENDERIELIEVQPSEIRFFIQKRTTVGKVVDIVSSTVTGNVATPGGLFVLSGEELKEAQRVASTLSK